MNWAFKVIELVGENLTPSESLTLVALGWCHNQETGRCDPGYEYLAKRTGLKRRAVIYAIDGLVSKGVIGKMRRRYKDDTGSRNKTNQYSLRGGAKFAPRVVQKMHPKEHLRLPSVPYDLAMLSDDPLMEPVDD